MREASDFDFAMEDLGRQFAAEEADAALAEDPDAVLCVRVHIHALRSSCLNVLAHTVASLPSCACSQDWDAIMQQSYKEWKERRASIVVLTARDLRARGIINVDWRRRPGYPAAYYDPPPWNGTVHDRPELDVPTGSKMPPYQEDVPETFREWWIQEHLTYLKERLKWYKGKLMRYDVDVWLDESTGPPAASEFWADLRPANLTLLVDGVEERVTAFESYPKPPPNLAAELKARVKGMYPLNKTLYTDDVKLVLNCEAALSRQGPNQMYEDHWIKWQPSCSQCEAVRPKRETLVRARERALQRELVAQKKPPMCVCEEYRIEGNPNPTLHDIIEDHKARAAQLQEVMRECSAALALVAEKRKKAAQEQRKAHAIEQEEREKRLILEARSMVEKHEAHCALHIAAREACAAGDAWNSPWVKTRFRCKCGYDLDGRDGQISMDGCTVVHKFDHYICRRLTGCTDPADEYWSGRDVLARKAGYLK